MTERKSGLLLHISSLPSKFGIGDFGKEAYKFIDLLKDTGFGVWQILPLGPVGPGNSPYMAYSGFAGEPLFINLEELVHWGLLAALDLEDCSGQKVSTVDYDRVRKVKLPYLRKAWSNFKNKGDESFHSEFHHFQNEHNWWLTDYALYQVCKEKFDRKPWNKWDKTIARRDTETLQELLRVYDEEIRYEKFVQFLFFRQWFRLKEYANSKGIQLFGDLPLYVSHDSADVWGNQDLFKLDEDGEPESMGGVPPDYFSEDGQLWGNPVFNWDRLKETEYQWWISRLYFNFHLFHIVRIDHFRGLEAFWAITKEAKSAKNGTWVSAYGEEMLDIMQSRLDYLPVVAEDLGIITPEVEQLRDRYKLPGMKVLQFAYESDATNLHLPHNYSGANVVYTGTHDNNTLIGWLETLTKNEERNLKSYFGEIKPELANTLIETIWASTAQLAIVPMQDILGLNEQGRMNTPGTASGNWTWRYKHTMLKASRLKYFKQLNNIYNRNNG